MNDQPRSTSSFPDTAEISQSMTGIAERSQRLVNDFVQRQMANGTVPDADPLNVGEAFAAMTQQMMANPAQVMQSSIGLWQDYLNLWQTTAQRMMGQDTDPVIEPEAGDRRFKDDAWEDNQVFDFFKQSYLLTSRWMQTSVNDVEGLDNKTA